MLFDDGEPTQPFARTPTPEIPMEFDDSDVKAAMDEGIGVASLAPPHDEHYYTERDVTFFGLQLLTDRWGLRALLHQLAATVPTEAELEESRQFREGPPEAYTPRPSDPTKLVNRFDEFYPGLKEATFRGIRELNSKQLRAGKVVFVNGQVQVWPETGFAHRPPSDFYPTQVTPATPGYEAVVAAELEAYRTQNKQVRDEDRQQAYSLLDHGLATDPRKTLEQIRSIAMAMLDRAISLEDQETIIEPIRDRVVPWAKQSAVNTALVNEVLGERGTPAQKDIGGDGSAESPDYRREVFWILGGTAWAL